MGKDQKIKELLKIIKDNGLSAGNLEQRGRGRPAGKKHPIDTKPVQVWLRVNRFREHLIAIHPICAQLSDIDIIRAWRDEIWVAEEGSMPLLENRLIQKERKLFPKSEDEFQRWNEISTLADACSKGKRVFEKAVKDRTIELL